MLHLIHILQLFDILSIINSSYMSMPMTNMPTLTNVVLQIMSYFATAEREKRRLKELASPEGRDDLNWYNQKEKRTVLEVMPSP